jgi:hypothetical protein
MALGLLTQKLKTSHHVQAEAERVQPRHPDVPLTLRIQVERESRRMAGYWHGRKLADTFLELTKAAGPGAGERINEYLQTRDDPRLAEIFGRLQDIYLAHQKGR